jgi:hypothetical protein
VLCVSIPFFIAMALLSYFLNQSLEQTSRIAENAVYFNTEIKDEAVLSNKEKFLKYTARYYQIIGWYSYKPQSGHGMTTWQKTQVAIKSYKYEKMIHFPKYTYVGLGIIESGFDPKCPHAGDEEGWLGIAKAAVGQAYIYYEEMKRVNPKLAQKLVFNYTGDKSLHDPINSLKIATVRLWGLNRLYGGDMRWIISTYHWGLARIWPLYTGRKAFKDKWYFYPRGTDMSKATIKDASSVRNPLQYFFIWSEIRQAFAAGRKDINKELINYAKKYIKNSSNEKRQWIHSWRYVNRLKDALRDVTEQKVVLNERIKKANKIIDDAEKAYRKIYKGKKTDWRKSEGIFKKLIRKLRKIKNKVS